MMSKGNIAPNGKKFPNPDVLLLSYTGCFTFMKSFELLRGSSSANDHVAHALYGRRQDHQDMVEYMVEQLKEEVIPKLERVSGVKFDIDRLRESLKKSVKAEDDLVHVLQSAKNSPRRSTPISAPSIYIGPIFGAFRGHRRRHRLCQFLREEVEDRLARAWGRSRLTATWARKSTGSWSRGRRTIRLPPVLEDVLRRGRGRRRLELRQGWRRLRISASATTPANRRRRWPNIASASTPTAACRCASTCSSITSMIRADGLLINSIRS